MSEGNCCFNNQQSEDPACARLPSQTWGSEQCKRGKVAKRSRQGPVHLLSLSALDSECDALSPDKPKIKDHNPESKSNKALFVRLLGCLSQQHKRE